MSHLKLVRLVGAVVALAGIPSLPVVAQTQAPSPPSPSAPPPNAHPEQMPKPPGAVQPGTAGTSATVPGQANPLIRMAVFSSDGSKIGTVQSVSTAPDGSVKSLHIKTGGFLGFGAKLVAIPEGRFTRNGDKIQLGLSAEEVSKLPEVKEQS
ncbi:MAG: PRC-barrel domain-containing protein [Hyphomicrobiaceae bacterium]|nr:PRC-barrel domain-containing protein [Hyphomicrobiaceae bacterium]